MLDSYEFIRVWKEKGTNTGWIPTVCWRLYKCFFQSLTTTLFINIIIPISKLSKIRLREIIHNLPKVPRLFWHQNPCFLKYIEEEKGKSTKINTSKEKSGYVFSFLKLKTIGNRGYSLTYSTLCNSYQPYVHHIQRVNNLMPQDCTLIFASPQLIAVLFQVCIFWKAVTNLKKLTF